jgi:hypothetical protein
VLLAAIRNDKPHNEAQRAAYADLASIMGRAAVHSGKIITWDEMYNSKFQFLPDIRFQAQSIQILMDLFPEETELKGLEIEFPDSEEAFIQGPEQETVFLPGGLVTRDTADQDNLQQDLFPSGAFGYRSFPPFELHGRLNKKPRPRGAVFYI